MNRPKKAKPTLVEPAAMEPESEDTPEDNALHDSPSSPEPAPSSTKSVTGELQRETFEWQLADREERELRSGNNSNPSLPGTCDLAPARARALKICHAFVLGAVVHPVARASSDALFEQQNRGFLRWGGGAGCEGCVCGRNRSAGSPLFSWASREPPVRGLCRPRCGACRPIFRGCVCASP